MSGQWMLHRHRDEGVFSILASAGIIVLSLPEVDRDAGVPILAAGESGKEIRGLIRR